MQQETHHTSPPRDEERLRDENEEAIANMFDGQITLIAVIRCGIHCGTVIHLYPGIEQQGQPMTAELAREYAERHGWKRRVRHGDRVWLCPQCLQGSRADREGMRND
jgi:threonine dehydrogenase-like Zn-dependent dehydrogenase